MVWKKLLDKGEWRTERWVLLALILSFILTIGMHFYPQSTIHSSEGADQKLELNDDLASKLKELESHLSKMESSLQRHVLSQGGKLSTEIDENMLETQRKSDEIKTILMEEPDITQSFLALEKSIQNKINFHNNVLEILQADGRGEAQKLMNGATAAIVHDDVLKAIQTFHQHEDIEVATNLGDSDDANDSGRVNDNVAYLLGITLLLFSLIYLMKSIRKRIKLQDRLLKAKEQLEQSIHIKEQFLSNMSHEIRTPLQTILGYTNRLAKEKLTSPQMQQIKAIQLAGENLLNIVNDILDISKMESGMMRLENVPFSISGLMHSIEGMFQPRVIEKGLFLNLHLNPKIPDVLIGDPTRLTQILVNLINNAIKFTEKGGIDIFQEIKEKTDDKIRLKFTIQDTGIGIAADKLKAIFERFEQADAKMTRIYGGSGLGLYLVQQLVNLQGGSVSVDSTPGRGSSFSVEIPYVIATDKTLPKAADSNLVSLKENFHGIKMLLVEDNLMNQRVVGMFFSDWGIDYDIADTGKTAIRQLEKSQYDLILMDVQMPEMDGYSATEYIRQNMQITTPIIAMTAHALAGEREKALSYGMDEYISKPVKEEDLYNIIAQFVPLIREHSFSISIGTTSPAATIDPDELNVDYNYLMQTTKGKRNHLKNILELFLRQAPSELAAMDKALRQEQFEQVARIAHSMKSTSGYVGMDKHFRPILENIEMESKSEHSNSERLSMLYLQLKSLTREAISKIRTEAMTLVDPQ